MSKFSPNVTKTILQFYLDTHIRACQFYVSNIIISMAATIATEILHEHADMERYRVSSPLFSKKYVITDVNVSYPRATFKMLDKKRNSTLIFIPESTVGMEDISLYIKTDDDDIISLSQLIRHTIDIHDDKVVVSNVKIGKRLTTIQVSSPNVTPEEIKRFLIFAIEQRQQKQRQLEVESDFLLLDLQRQIGEKDAKLQELETRLRNLQKTQGGRKHKRKTGRKHVHRRQTMKTYR